MSKLVPIFLIAAIASGCAVQKTNKVEQSVDPLAKSKPALVCTTDGSIKVCAIDTTPGNTSRRVCYSVTNDNGGAAITCNF